MSKIKNKLIEIRGHRCEKCNLTIWIDQPIPLEVHHIERDCTDIDKLQLLCANCHALTDNYRGRGIRKSSLRKITNEEFKIAALESKNIREILLKLKLAPKGGNYKTTKKRLVSLGLIDRFRPPEYHAKMCPSCGVEFFGRSKFCSCSCANKFNMNGSKSRKVERPPNDVIKKMVSSMGYSAVGRVFGVSDNAVRKWLEQE